MNKIEKKLLEKYRIELLVDNVSSKEKQERLDAIL